MDEKLKRKQKRYLQGFGIVVVTLAFVRAVWPSAVQPVSSDVGEGGDSIVAGDVAAAPSALQEGTATAASAAFVRHPVRGVRSYAEAFPDTNGLQLSAAVRHGIAPVGNRVVIPWLVDGRRLVYVGGSPFYDVDTLRRSVPYLVPRAALLLHDMGRAFFDSLRVKQVPLHRFVVSSVLRTKEDVDLLRGHNRNATENSCHLYGTTFDISYNRYRAVAACDTCSDRVQSDTLKRVLSEVLRDMRSAGRCYVKHERKQGCFHVTVN